MNKIKNKPIRYFIISILLLGVIIYIFPKIISLFEASYTLEYGELKLTDEAEACIVRDEKVYFAENGGRANYYINEGTLVRSGTTVMDFTESSEEEASEEYNEIKQNIGKNIITTNDFVTQNVGIVSYFADGYEGKLTPETLNKISYEAFSDIKKSKVIDLNRNIVAKGEPAYKVVDRTKWYLVCFMDAKSIDRYKKGQNLQVEFEDDYIEATVLDVEKKDGKLRVILETNYYYDQFNQKRTDDVVLTTYDEKGLIINNSSITEKKKQKGVYVRNKTGEYNFVPVQVYLTDGKKSLVADTFYYDSKGKMVDTVEIYDEILKKPK